MSDIAAPAYRVIPIVPVLKPGAMEGKGPYIANEKINSAIGFPGELVEDWHDKAIAKMGELLSKYRSLKVYMDACVRALRRVLRQVPLLYWHTRSKEYARGASGLDAQCVSSLFHFAQQAISKVGRCARFDARSAG